MSLNSTTKISPNSSTSNSGLDAFLDREHAWDSKDIGSNSISSMLYENTAQGNKLTPNFLIPGLKAANRMDSIPPVPPTILPRVANRDFDAYLASITEVIDKYQLHKALGPTSLEGIPLLGDNLDLEAQVEADSLRRLHKLLPLKAIPGMDRFNRTRMLSSTPQNWKNIPAIFTVSDFSLCEPDTFATVYQGMTAELLGTNALGVSPTISSGGPGTAQEAAYRKLSDSLTQYQDTIEIKLLKEISRRSASFFGALETLQHLEQETETCLERINTLRANLDYIRQSSIKNGLSVIRLKQKRSDLTMLYGAVKLICQAKQAQPIIKMLVAQTDYIGALSLLRETSLLIVGKFSGLYSSIVETEIVATGISLQRNQSVIPLNMDLRSVPSINLLNLQLRTLSNELLHAIQTEFEASLIKDLVGQLEIISNTPFNLTPGSVPLSTGTSKTYGSIATNAIRNIVNESYVTTPNRNIVNESYTASPSSNIISLETISLEIPALSPQDEALKATLTPLVYCLIRMGRLGKAMGEYKEGLIQQLKAASKQYYPKITETLSHAKLDNSTNPSKGGGPLVTGAGGEWTANDKKFEQDQVAKTLKSYSFDMFYATLIKIYIFFLRSLQRAGIVNHILISIVKEAEYNGITIGCNKIEDLYTPTTATTVNHMVLKTPSKLNAMDDDDDFIASTHIMDESAKPISPPVPNPSPKDNLNANNLLNASTNSLDGGYYEFGQVYSDIQTMYFDAVDLTHKRCAKLIAVRQDQNSKLNPKDFYRLYNATWEFLGAGEALCGKLCFGLKGSILAQAKSYLGNFHDERSKQISALLDNEQWFQADIPIDFQRISEELKALSAPSPPLAFETDGESGGQRQPAPSLDSLNKDQKTSRTLTIDGKDYHVVGTLLIFIKSLTDYVMCAKQFPSLAPEILTRIFEFLKLFNSRTCQLILGGAAVQSAGLDSITAKQIILCSQCLLAVMQVIPLIKDGIGIHLGQKQQALLATFSRILEDYRNHVDELYHCLVNIMADRLETHSTNLLVRPCHSNFIKSINWDQPDQKDFGSDGISVTMSTIVIETMTHYNNIAEHLPRPILIRVMAGIFESHNTMLERKFNKIDIFSVAGKDRLMADARFFTESLSRLEGIDGPGPRIEACITTLKIKDPRSIVTNKKTEKDLAAIAPPAPPNPIKPTFSYDFAKILRDKMTKRE